jgi:hypothetical protein
MREHVYLHDYKTIYVINFSDFSLVPARAQITYLFYAYLYILLVHFQGGLIIMKHAVHRYVYRELWLYKTDELKKLYEIPCTTRRKLGSTIPRSFPVKSYTAYAAYDINLITEERMGIEHTGIGSSLLRRD